MRASSCFGVSIVDSGQRRVPEPPHRITGTTGLLTERAS
jgi:hypothetical protein